MTAPDLKRAFNDVSGLKYEPERWNDADNDALYDFLRDHSEALVYFHGRTRISMPEVVQYVNMATPPDQQLRFAAITGRGTSLLPHERPRHVVAQGWHLSGDEQGRERPYHHRPRGRRPPRRRRP